MSTRWLERRHAALLVALLAVALYAPTASFGRVRYDDYWLWSDTSPLRHVDAATLRDVFLELDRGARRPLGSEYLPVRDVSVALDMAVWGADDHGPHATQLALFAGCVVVLGMMLVRFGVPPAVAWLGMLIWAAHPIHVESVAWLSERKGMLAALLTGATALAWLRYRGGRARGWLAVAALAAVAATWSKAPAMFAVPALASWDLLMLPAARRRWIAIAVVGAATALAAIPVVMLASEARIIGSAEAGGDRDGRLATALGATGHYVESLALARPPAISYPIDSDGPGVGELALGGVAVAGSAIAAAVWLRRARRRRRDNAAVADPDHSRLAPALLAWAWIGYLPSAHVLVPLHVVVADRFALVWSLAPCVAAAWLLDRLRPPWRLAASAVVVGGLAIATIRAEGAWASSDDLLARAVASNPHDYALTIVLADELRGEGRDADALAVLDGGLAALPDEPHLLDARSRLLIASGRGDEALADAARGVASDAASALDFDAQLLVGAGRARDAIPLAERAVARHPEIAAYQRTLAVALVAAGRARDAATPLGIAMMRDPQPGDAALLATVARALAPGTR